MLLQTIAIHSLPSMIFLFYSVAQSITFKFIIFAQYKIWIQIRYWTSYTIVKSKLEDFNRFEFDSFYKGQIYYLLGPMVDV